MIPKIIHFCWFGDKKMPRMARKCLNSWKKYCPDYEIKLWNEENFDLDTNKYVREAYEAKKWAFITDYARLYIVYHYGGIYLDTDVELIKPLDSLLNYNAFFGIESTQNKCIATGLGFGAEKGYSIVKEIMEQYENISFKLNDGTYDMTPCPDRNTLVFEKYGYDHSDKCKNIDGVQILSSEYMCPKDFKTNKLNITKNTLSIHHFDGSWQPFSTKIKCFIANLIGYQK